MVAMAIVAGAVAVPMEMSTLSSSISLRAFRVEAAGSSRRRADQLDRPAADRARYWRAAAMPLP